MRPTTQRVVVCAAIRSRETGKIVCGARHFDTIMRAIVFPNHTKDSEWLSAEQGFIDQYGVFLTRREAWDIASKAGQIKVNPDRPPGPLFSEDLY